MAKRKGYWQQQVLQGSLDANCKPSISATDTVVLEFNQYTTDSRWRCTTINRKDHREEGNEADGFYGGIRKLKNQEEISTWKQLWPTEVLEQHTLYQKGPVNITICKHMQTFFCIKRIPEFSLCKSGFQKLENLLPIQSHGCGGMIPFFPILLLIFFS